MNVRLLPSSLLLSLALGAAMGGVSAVACQGQSDGDDEGDGGAGAGDAAPVDYTASPLLSEAALLETSDHLASDELDGRDEGTPGGILARDYLVSRLTECGVEPALDGYLQPITTGQGTNVLGVIRGASPARAERHVVISAHYDHLGHCDGDICNGANDNAAGVAIVLGMACALAEAPPPRSVMVAFWDAEEPPTFLTAAMGSRFYADNPVVPLEQTDAVIVLDLVGADIWSGFGGHFLLGADQSPELAAALDAAKQPEGLLIFRAGLHLVEEQPLGIGRQPWSDYDAFRNKQKPVLFLSNGQNREYHTSADEISSLDGHKMELEARHLVDVVSQLAHAEATPTFDGARTDHVRDAETVIAVLDAALANGGMVDNLGLGAETTTKLEGDLTAARAAADKVASGGTLGESEIRRLRDGAQRVMCHAAPYYNEATCNVF
jgi:hypothetical protein